jgi:hypothetical protein
MDADVAFLWERQVGTERGKAHLVFHQFVLGRERQALEALHGANVERAMGCKLFSIKFIGSENRFKHRPHSFELSLLDRVAVTGRFHEVLQLSIKLSFPRRDSGTRCPKSIMQGEELQGASCVAQLAINRARVRGDRILRAILAYNACR